MRLALILALCIQGSLAFSLFGRVQNDSKNDAASETDLLDADPVLDGGAKVKNRQKDGGKPAKGAKQDEVKYSVGSGNFSGGAGKVDCEQSARSRCQPSQDCNALLQSIRCCNEEAYNCANEDQWTRLLHYQVYLNKAYNDFCQYTYKAINCFQHIEWGKNMINMFCNNAAITRHVEFTRSFCEHKHQACKKLVKTNECIRSWSDLMCCKAVSGKLAAVFNSWDDKCAKRGQVEIRDRKSQFRMGGAGGETSSRGKKIGEMSGTFVIEVEAPPERRRNYKIMDWDW